MAHSKEATEAWNALLRHVDVLRDPAFDKELWRLVKNFVTTQLPPKPANAPVTGTNGKKLRSGMTVRFGRSAGTAIEELETKDLLWYIARAEEGLDDPSRARYREQNMKELELMQAELKTR